MSLHKSSKMNLVITILFCMVYNSIDYTDAKGLLLLYKPKDVTSGCALSKELRYDISYGMGMADTISLILRTETAYDFRCIIEIVTDKTAFLIVVIYYTNSVVENCFYNPQAFVILEESSCTRVCDYISTAGHPKVKNYFTAIYKHHVKLLYTGNNSLNSDMSVNFYQITATASRLLKPGENCTKGNETFCSVANQHFCFTNGVVCDGIKNCGVNDWFDERQKACGLPIQNLGFAPVITVIAVFCCALLAGGHLLMKHLPSVAKSFFIFNINEDNRLYVDPVYLPPTDATNRDQAIKRKYSIIPVSSSTSSSNNESNDEDLGIEYMEKELESLCMTGAVIHMKPTEVNTQEPDTSISANQGIAKPSGIKKIRDKFMSASKFIHKKSHISNIKHGKAEKREK